MRRKISIGISLFFIPALLGLVFSQAGTVSSEKQEIGSLENNISVSLSVGGRLYSFIVSEGATVYEALQALALKEDLYFTAKYYPTLGYFIEEIDGIRNGGGTYWTLYINDMYSNYGASGTVLEEGDRIQWKFEKK